MYVEVYIFRISLFWVGALYLHNLESHVFYGYSVTFYGYSITFYSGLSLSKDRLCSRAGLCKTKTCLVFICFYIIVL